MRQFSPPLRRKNPPKRDDDHRAYKLSNKAHLSAFCYHFAILSVISQSKQSVTVEMFGRMVVFLCFHSLCVGSLNETSSTCDDTDKCVRLCCDRESDGCISNFESFAQKLVKNFNLSELELAFGKPCEKMEFVDDFRWKFEVNELNRKATAQLKCQ